MTEDELKSIESGDWPNFVEHRDALVAEVRRLRGLIEKARGAVDGWCPWCNQYVNGIGDPDTHPNCPAFTPSGEVR